MRNITNAASIKIRDLPFEDGDFFVGYTDGILEARNSSNDLYGIPRFEKAFQRAGDTAKASAERVFKTLYEDVMEFMGKEVFMDDVSCFVFRRDSMRDIIADKAELDALLKELDITQRTIKIDLKGRTRAEVVEALRKERLGHELKARIANMEILYKLGEYGRLKQEVTLCYKQGFVHDRMTFFLEKIIKNEEKAKTTKLEDRINKKYEMLEELLKK